MSCLLSVVVPVYNEEQTLPRFLATMRPVLAGVTQDYEIIFVADPCTDRTVDLIRAEHELDPRIKLLLFSRRFGQPAATLGGMTYARGEAVVVIDMANKSVREGLDGGPAPTARPTSPPTKWSRSPRQ